MKRFLVIISVMLCFIAVKAQRNEIYNSRIASLQVVAGEDWLSPPVINLNGDNSINIAFDDLTHEYHRYVYTIQHCEADWTPSTEIFASDYVEGFSENNTIDNLEESLNTNVLYTHYCLQIPNDRCRIKMSGNYRLIVYDENNNNEKMFSACFMVVEPNSMNVSMNVSTNTDIDVNRSHQQVAMQIGYGSLSVTNQANQIKTVVMQNGRWDNAVINSRPQYVLSNGMRWEHDRDLIFEAGNEYRKFEMLDVNHTTMGMEKIDWDGKQYHAYIWAAEPRPSYVYDEDANGAFYIRNSDNEENDRISDYLTVHFVLKSPRANGDVYLNGVWTNDQFLPEYKMEYDDVEQCYKGTVQLKQGYYSYQYLILKSDGTTATVPSEGSFYQTENKYQVLVYYRGIGERTDRLVGYQQVQLK